MLGVVAGERARATKSCRKQADFVCADAAIGITPYAKVRAFTMANASKKSNSKPLSKSALLEAITNAVGEDMSKKQVKLVMETLVALGHRELKKTGVFVLPGFAKFTVVKKPATRSRQRYHRGPAKHS